MKTDRLTTQPGPITAKPEGSGNTWLPLASRLVLLALLLGLTACKTTRQVTKGEPELSGFLGDYSGLQKGEKGRANLVYIDSTAQWSKYTKIMIKPLELWKSEDPESPLGKISPEDQQMLCTYFYDCLADAVAKDYQIVKEPGPDVLVLRAALTDGKKSKPVANFITSVYLPLKVISFGKRLITGTDIAVGSVVVEAEFLDGASNRRVAAVVDRRAGTKALRTKFDSTWGDVKLSFDWWAQQLVTRLAEEKGGAVEKTAI